MSALAFTSGARAASWSTFSTTRLWFLSIFVPSPYHYVLWGVALALFHLGAEWTSPRDRTFISRLLLAGVAIAPAAAGAGISPVVFA